MIVSTATERIAMKHGAGGRSMRRLIERVFLTGISGPATDMDDGAVIPIGDRWLIVTTDSHVIHPLVFPGGDIGRLSVAGTVNDLAMMGATEPLGLTCGAIVEEGFPVEELVRLHESMRIACEEAGTTIVAGDTKVMRRGEIDGVVFNTTGIGLAARVVRDSGLQPGDAIVVTGSIGDHGTAVMAARHEFDFGHELRSDVAPLNGLIRMAMAAAGDAIHAMKDPTRGGVATALHEMAGKSGVGILVDEASLPVRDAVRGVSELVGIDPLLVANEGKALIGVRRDAASRVLEALRSHPLGADAAVIGVCTEDHAGMLILDTGFGCRLVAEPEGELLPRIC